MEDNQFIYLPETLISEHTCKPIFKSTIFESPLFWCELCKAIMESPASAINHLGGNKHKKKLASRDFADRTDSISQKLDESDNSSTKEPLSKKPKYDARCEDCKIEFTSEIHAGEHFSGKKHAAMLTEISAGKDIEKIIGSKNSGIQNSSSNDVEKLLLKCGSCKMTFTSNVHALEHFKGKLHAEAVDEASRRVSGVMNRGGNIRARGRGVMGQGIGRGQGPGSSLGRGNKEMNLSNNTDRGRGTGRGERGRGSALSTAPVFGSLNSSNSNNKGMDWNNNTERGRGTGRGGSNVRGRGHALSTAPIFGSLNSSNSNNIGMNSSNNTERGCGSGRGDRGRGRGDRGRGRAPVFNTSNSSNSNRFSNQNLVQNNERRNGSFFAPAGGGSAPISTYSNKISEISSDINQLKQRLGSLYRN